MKTKVLSMVTMLLIAAMTMTGCKDTKIDFQKGDGSITYENQTYPLNFSTMTTSTNQDGDYTHTVILTNTENGNYVFSFMVINDKPENTILPGNYTTAFQSDTTANFKVNSAGDFLAGTMKVTVSGDKHILTFEGTTIDELTETKNVKFTYTGVLNESEE